MEQMPYLKSSAFGVWVRVGSSDEDTSNNGIAHVIEHMLFKGTKERSAKQIADEMARIGGNINAFTSKECTSYYATTLSEHLPIAIDIISDMLIHSTIDEKSLKKEKGVIIEEIDMYDDSPEDLVHELLQQKIWKNHPLGYIISGTKKVVRKISREQILDFMDRYYVGDNIVISVAGNFEPKEVLDLLEQHFHEIPKTTTKDIITLEMPNYHKVLVRRDKDIEQMHINIAFDGLSYLSEERFTQSIVNSILGGSVNSRLFQKIREEAGLTYSIYSYGSSYKETGLMHIYAAMNPSQTPVVIKKIQQVIHSMQKKGVTEEELSMTKEQIKTELILGSESARSRMNTNGKAMLNRGRIAPMEELVEGINRVTVEDVKIFAKDYLNLSQCSIAMVGNMSELDMKELQLRKLG